MRIAFEVLAKKARILAPPWRCGCAEQIKTGNKPLLRKRHASVSGQLRRSPVNSNVHLRIVCPLDLQERG